jgi:hypothetical protein
MREKKDVRISTDAALHPTHTISFISCEKIMFALCAHFQEHNNHINQEVAVCPN